MDTEYVPPLRTNFIVTHSFLKRFLSSKGIWNQIVYTHICGPPRSPIFARYISRLVLSKFYPPEQNSSLLTQFLSDSYRLIVYGIRSYMITYVGLHDAPYVCVKFLDRYSVSSTPQNQIHRHSPNSYAIPIV